MPMLPRLIVVLALLSGLALLLAGPGFRFEWWDFRFGFVLMRWAVYGAIAATGLAVLGLAVGRIRRAGTGRLVLALLISLPTILVPLMQLQQARSLPRIHDITTDTVDPPDFEAIAPLRANAPNPVEYPGEGVAREQREAYPDIVPLATDVYPTLVFDHALELAHAMSWEIVAADAGLGRIEATDTTLWFGFKDDVVVRIRAGAQGSIVDVRSKSRVGLSDVGANAKRIRNFLERLERRLN